MGEIVHISYGASRPLCGAAACAVIDLRAKAFDGRKEA
jgi:hypothetical protein